MVEKLVKTQPGVMILSCITYNDIRTVIMVNGNINAQKYIEILDNNLWPLDVRHFHANDNGFQDGNAQACQDMIVQEFMGENQIVHIDWPAQSPDFNITKNVCICLSIYLPNLSLTFALHLCIPPPLIFN